jgi:UDP-2,4-diacetamido-2,4,6-trideoxy-beta-L-altropyranose hydrolase
MRCLALAGAWKEREMSEVIFVMHQPGAGIASRLREGGFHLRTIDAVPGSPEDANLTGALYRELGAQWCVIDGYQFNARYQRQVHDFPASTLFIDDFGHCENYSADLVLNQNIYAHDGLYPGREPSVRLLLGTKYVLLRYEFLRYRNFPRIYAGNAKKILVTFGGSDTENMTGSVITMLRNVKMTDLEVIVIAGVSNPNISTLQEMIAGDERIRILRDVQDMPERMAWADIAISAGGSTVYECAFMGLPAILCPIAQNQKPVVDEMSRIGCAIDGRTIDILHPEKGAEALTGLLNSPDARNEFSKKMRELVDGNGAVRVIGAMVHLGLHVRRVQKSDCLQVFEWINDPLVRQQSFRQASISLEEHKKWFSAVFSNPDLVYYIAYDNHGNPAGQARFSIEGENAVISVLLDKGFRGRDLGAEMIRLSTKTFFSETPVTTVNAYVKCENMVSCLAFIRAGYRDCGIVLVEGQRSHHLIQQRGI